MGNTKSLSEISLEYYNRGYCVLPVAPYTKRPLLRSWEKYSKVRPEPGDLVRWFDNLTSAGIGMVTGKISGLIVVDIDTVSGIGPEEITRDYPTEMIARSASGGYHLYYKYPESGIPVPNRVSFLPGVDLRGDGGFVVMPPTQFERGSYSWISLGAPGRYPEGLIPDPGYNNRSEGEKWVTEALKGSEEGLRNDTTARLAGYFFNKSMPLDIVMSIMREWNEKNDPPLGIRELETTIQSVYKKHQRSGTSERNKSNKEYSLEDDPGPKEVFDLVTMTDYFKEFGEVGVQWDVDQWLSESSVVFLVSPPESYKTWLLLDLAVSVASGRPFLGEFKVYNPGPVIIIQQEDSHAGLTERLSVIIQSRLGLHPEINGEEISMPKFPDLPIYIHPSRNLRFDDEEVMSELESFIDEIRPRVVIIDPLYSAAKVDNYMADSTEDMFELKRFRDLYGTSFVIAHHSKKNVDPDSTSREDSWGSQFLNAFLEAGWQIRRSPKLPENEVVVRRHSKTMGNMEMVSVAFDISTQYPTRYEVEVKPYNRGLATAPARAEIIELLEDDGPLTASEIATRTGKHRSTVSRQLGKLEMASQVEKMPDGRYKSNPGGGS